MNRLIIFFVLIFSFLQANEGIKTDIFIGHDFCGQMKVDRNDIKKEFSDFRFNTKLSLSQSIYKSMDIVGSILYETYYMEDYNTEYNLIPVTLGVRFSDDKLHKNSRHYITLSIGTNKLLNAEDIPIGIKKNGFAELDFGTIYKDKYLFEFAYKQHAFSYKPLNDSPTELWNGRVLSFNVGYKIK